MKAVNIKRWGGPEVLVIEEFDKPVRKANEVLVRVHATALNRADLLQRQGKYPPPQGASEILGLEMAGIVDEVGTNSTKYKPGDKVFALVPGGGYAQFATVHQDMLFAIPKGLSFEEAAAIPEVFLTAYQALYWLGKLKTHDSVLIHAGASGVGTAAIQLAKLENAFVAITASSSKHLLCRELGADVAIDYTEGPFLNKVKDATENQGVDVVVDFIGAPFFSQNLECLKTDGRFIMLALLGGSKVGDIDLRKVLQKRIQIKGSTLRSRSLDYQIKLSKEFFDYAIPLFSEKKLKPIIDKVFSWHQVQDAHQYMEDNKNAGKIILKID